MNSEEFKKEDIYQKAGEAIIGLILGAIAVPIMFSMVYILGCVVKVLGVLHYGQ
jgi:hypothetical protein